MADDIAKIISKIDVDYAPAIKSANEFAISLKTLNEQLDKLKNTANVTADQINKEFGKAGKFVAADAQKMAQVTQQQLAKLEASLVSTAQKLQGFGVATPSVKSAIGGVRGLRDQLAAGKALNEEQMRYVSNAQKIAQVEANNARIIEQEIKLKSNLIGKEEELSTVKQRAAVAEQNSLQQIDKQYADYQAKQRAEIEKQEEQMLRERDNAIQNEQKARERASKEYANFQQQERARVAKEEEQMWQEQVKRQQVAAKETQQQANQMWKEREQLQALADKESERQLQRQLQLNDLRLREVGNAKKLLPTLEAQVASMQRSVEVSRLKNTPLTQQLALMRRQIMELRKKLGIEGKITEAEAAQVMQLQKQANTIKQNIAMMKTDMLRRQDPTGKGGSENMWERRGGWFLAGGMMFGALDAMRQMVEVSGEVEKGIITIGRVMEDSAFSADAMRQELLKLAKDYGMVWSEVEDIAIRWAQAGYNMRDTLELTKASLLALNTAELDANYSTSGLIAIMAQWALTAEDLVPIIDKINKTADDYAVEFAA